MLKGTVNKVIIIGNLGADPELRNMPDGTAIANLRIATTESWTDKKNPKGERMEHTEWHRVAFWGRQAKSFTNTCAKVPKFMLKVLCAPVSGKTRRVTTDTAPKFAAGICLPQRPGR